MQTISWKNFTIRTDFHPAMPAGSLPGIPPAYNQWNPANVQVVNNNLQLSLQRNSPTIWQGQHVWAASEAVVQNSLGYGTYCCTFRIVDASGKNAWAQFSTLNASPNTSTIFGVFLYDAVGTGGSNPNCEIDIIEVGFQNQPNNGQGWIGQQPGGPALNNAQFVIQPWDAGTPNQPDWNMVKRINIDTASIPDPGDVTVICQWTAAGAPVTYYLAYGAYTSANFPFATAMKYTTPVAANSYIPALNSNMRLHLNLWPYGGPTTNAPVFVQVSNLEIPS
ncbi:MAG TPA: hypothetical protein VFU15_10710 [Bacteroidia bacterium]|nr:hypothetical protein [Bacteroidia bacterium]